MDKPSERLLRIARELTAISESALAYCRDPFDIDRFHRVGALARELMAEVATTDLPAYDREVASVAGYTTPKLDVRGGVFDADGRVLLVREVADGGRWTLPGGWCDILEGPREAIEREVREEAGLAVRAAHLAAVVDRDKWPHYPPHDYHIYKLFFVCEPVGMLDPGYASTETSEVGWFALEELPELSTGRVLPEQIWLLREHWRNPGPAHID
ncbi:MAG: NUDIX hydrolase [Tessaracoccus sp.]|uniref:NUDIX hydrolase n=1 Tax=Tessaracoccus sp. TaxID=1971211 RepID=UPI001EBCC30E|nr:NUDIX hydrolase [Tessaracoccus sp.]MBK7821379.1 NUDIX hydrolase [Tessaracoccus sp.]